MPTKGTKEAAPAKRTVGNVNVPGHTTNLRADKFDAMERALLSVLPRKAPGLTQAEMVAAVERKGSKATFPGTTHMWWAKSAQLDLEERGIVVREKTKPLRWHRVR